MFGAGVQVYRTLKSCNFAPIYNSITYQSIVLKSYPNPQKTWRVLQHFESCVPLAQDSG